MISDILVILTAFSVYRLARDLTLEEGPFSLYARFQGWAENQSNWLKRGLMCPICLSFWLALLFTLLLGLLTPFTWPVFLIHWLGIAGGAAFLLLITG